jgi:hypothetical protein
MFTVRVVVALPLTMFALIVSPAAVTVKLPPADIPLAAELRIDRTVTDWLMVTAKPLL